MCLLQCQCALRLADHDTWDECGTGTKMGGMDGAQDSARCLPALRQAPDPRLPRRRGCFATRSAREIGCLSVSAVNAVSAWCLPARESTCLASLAARQEAPAKVSATYMLENGFVSEDAAGSDAGSAFIPPSGKALRMSVALTGSVIEDAREANSGQVCLAFWSDDAATGELKLKDIVLTFLKRP